MVFNFFRNSRPAMLTPPGSHKDYNRFKYYSALRSGFKHMPEEGRHDESFLEPPVHVVDSELFVYNIPFYSARKFFHVADQYILAPGTK